MVEFKAELLRKKAEFKVEKKKAVASGSSSQPRPMGRTGSKRKAVADEDSIKQERDNRIGDEVDPALLARSEESLRKKAKMYAALQRGDKLVSEEFGAKEIENILVDFDQKLYSRMDHPEGEEHERDDGDLDRRDGYGEDEDEDEDDWVEYEDEFGRTRYGKKSELEPKK